MITLLLAGAIAAGSPARDAQWFAMFRRQADIINPLMKRLGLPDRYEALCRAKLDLFAREHPKDGTYPLGVIQWNELSDADFKVALFGLDQVQTSFMEDCLADIKVRQKAAGL